MNTNHKIGYVTPEVIYGMVLNTVGKDTANFRLTTSLVATTSEHSGRKEVVLSTENVPEESPIEVCVIVDPVCPTLGGALSLILIPIWETARRTENGNNEQNEMTTKKEHSTHKSLEDPKEVIWTENESPRKPDAKCGPCNEDGMGAPAGPIKTGNAAGHECTFGGGSKFTFGKPPHCGHDADDPVYVTTKEKCPGPEETVHPPSLGCSFDKEESLLPCESTNDNTLSE